MKANIPLRRLLAIPVMTALLMLASALAGPAFAAAGNSSGCPTSIKNILVANNVAANFSNSGNTTTYTFLSLTNENPVDGVPGLVKYCVYPTPASLPNAVTVQAIGANGANWIYKKDPADFAFVRPGGNKTNIPLDGKTTTMGTAIWETVPTDQTIILHIADPKVCASIYGGTPPTCFVKPKPGPICNKGDSSIAYNAMPFGVVNCNNPSLGFEATQTNEFGDRVALAGTNRTLVSLKVLFSSFACSDSGHWNTGNCVTSAPNATFTHPITANIYEVADCSGTPCPGNLLASVNQTKTIPYRSSADAVKCPLAYSGETAGSRWFNPDADPVQVPDQCEAAKKTVLEFNFPTGTMLPDQVIWTVKFNTTHYGYTPIGESTTCFVTSIPGPGCPYDSLNVGAKSHVNAPYAGTDIDDSEAFISFGTPSALLVQDFGWQANRPEGAIITTAP